MFSSFSRSVRIPLRGGRVRLASPHTFDGAFGSSQSLKHLQAVRNYISRAHPRPIPEHSISDALEELLKDANARNVRRRRKWRRNKSKFPEDAETRNQTEFSETNETIELALNLNLDPRKPGQALRGSVLLPSGSGKTVNCLVFSTDASIVQDAEKAGATCGGEDLVDRITNGDIALESFQRSLATHDMTPHLRKVARLLGPRGLMPNAKDGTLLETPAELVDALETQSAGKEVVYRTEKEGIVHIIVGKASFGLDKLLENIGQVMKEVFQAKPESYGKGKKKKSSGGKKKGSTSAAKYLLRASVSSTQGKGIRLDLRTVDPSSVFFLTKGEASSSSSRTENQEAA